MERIREAAQRLGYVPDRMAQAMRWGRTGIIALVVPNFANPYYSALAVEVQRAAWEADLEVLVYANPTEDLAQVSRAVSARRVDGGIIVVSHYTPEELKAHLPLEIPWVGVGYQKGSIKLEMNAYDMEVVQWVIHAKDLIKPGFDIKFSVSVVPQGQTQSAFTSVSYSF